MSIVIVTMLPETQKWWPAAAWDSIGGAFAALLKAVSPSLLRFSLSGSRRPSVSLVVGLFFGLWPALKAAKLDPIEALRYE